MRSAPTLNIWMSPFSSVAILEKLALLKIAFCKAPVFSRASSRRTSVMTSTLPAASSEKAADAITGPFVVGFSILNGVSPRSYLDYPCTSDANTNVAQNLSLGAVAPKGPSRTRHMTQYGQD